MKDYKEFLDTAYVITKDIEEKLIAAADDILKEYDNILNEDKWTYIVAETIANFLIGIVSIQKGKIIKAIRKGDK